MSSICRFLPILLLAGAGLQCAGASIVLYDPFTDANLEGGADASGIAWYDRSSNTDLGIVPDPTVFNTGNALRMTVSNAQINRGIIGKLDQAFTLANPGDTLTLQFKFRFTTTAGSMTPGSAPVGFTFGFYNSDSTPVTGSNSTESDNDFGYRGEFAAGTSGQVGFYKEDNTSAGGLGTGTGDGSAITVVNPTAVAVNDFAAHTGSLTLTYNSPTNLGLSLSYDGNVVGTGTSSGPYLTFDEIVFSQGNASGFLLDDVTVTFVPEPGSMALLALCGAFGLARRRR